MTPDDLEDWLLSEESRQAVERAGEEADKEGRHVARRCGSVATFYCLASHRGSIPEQLALMAVGFGLAGLWRC